MKDWIVVVGNVVDGFSFYGTFTNEDAHEFAQGFTLDGWSIVRLTQR